MQLLRLFSLGGEGRVGGGGVWVGEGEGRRVLDQYVHMGERLRV